MSTIGNYRRHYLVNLRPLLQAWRGRAHFDVQPGRILMGLFGNVPFARVEKIRFGDKVRYFLPKYMLYKEEHHSLALTNNFTL